MTEHVFDRLPEFDPKSKQFPIRTLLAARSPRSYTWAKGPQLDQGVEGACVGFGVSDELSARPVPVAGIDNAFARNLYYDARRVDEWEGEDYEGTSVLAGMKVAKSRAYFDEYRWAFGLPELLVAISYHGPAVLGLNWLADMEHPDETGLIHASGQVLGGHCVIARGVSVSRKLVRITNSWGVDWGKEGDAFISWTDLGVLLSDGGEAAIPVHRNRV